MKKKVTPLNNNTDDEVQMLTDKPATPYQTTGKKRIRRGKDAILIDKLNKFYGSFEAVEVHEALTTAIEAVKKLEEVAAKNKKKSVNIMRIAKKKSKEELQLMIQQLQEALKDKQTAFHFHRAVTFCHCSFFVQKKWRQCFKPSP